MNTNNPRCCKRCGLILTADNRGEYVKPKQIDCPICKYPAYRFKALYRSYLREQYYCTNDNCRVRFTIVSFRSKDIK